LLQPIAVGQVGLRLAAELSGAFVKFTSEMDRQRAGAPKRGEGWREVGQVDGDDAAVEIGVETAEDDSTALIIREQCSVGRRDRYSIRSGDC
jgi:hypothetical protein